MEKKSRKKEIERKNKEVKMGTRMSVINGGRMEESRKESKIDREKG